MRTWAAALVAAGALVVLTAVTIVSSASGTPSGSVLAAPAAVTVPAELDVRLGRCSPGGGAGASTVDLTGPCSGRVTGSFACVLAGDVQALSIRRPLGGGRDFYLTVVIPEFEGPGSYTEDEVSAQVVGLANSPRWTSRGLHFQIEVPQPGVFELAGGSLLPEPGTPARGVLELGGRAVCR